MSTGLTTELDSNTLRRSFSTVPSAVVAVAADLDGAPIGIAASTFVAVSLDPPLVAFCIQHGSTTWRSLRNAPRIGLSVLGQDHHVLARQLAGPAHSRFEGTQWSDTGSGALLLDDAGAAFECAIERSHPAGDHDIVVMRVHGVRATPVKPPLVFHCSAFRSLGPSW